MDKRIIGQEGKKMIEKENKGTEMDFVLKEEI
jgi:hypothetical protein